MHLVFQLILMTTGVSEFDPFVYAAVNADLTEVFVVDCFVVAAHLLPSFALLVLKITFDLR